MSRRRAIGATQVGQIADTRVDGNHYLCHRCGRIVDGHPERGTQECRDCRDVGMPLGQRLLKRLALSEQEDEAKIDAAIHRFSAERVRAGLAA